MGIAVAEIEELLLDIRRLPRTWNPSGSLHSKVLEAIAALPRSCLSVEVGTGKSTLLLSHLSERHLVFTLDEESLHLVRGSPLLGQNAEFIVGPAQLTLPRYEFPAIDLALIDGPHGYPFPELNYYSIYPHLRAGAFLIIDDLQIPTINHLYRLLREDDMFEEFRVVRNTGFLRRTSQPTFDPLGDNWWKQRFNQRRLPGYAFRLFSYALRSFRHH